MSGTWLAKVGRGLLSEKTFERMIAPSIADLQLESGRGSLVRWKHYIGIIAVLIYALLQDLRSEVLFAFESERNRFAWKRAAVWYAAFVVLLTVIGLKYDLPSDMSLRDVWRLALISKGLKAIIAAVIPGMMAAALYLARRSCSRRSIMIVTLMVATLMTVFALAVRPVRVSAERGLFGLRPAPIYSDRLDETWWADVQGGIQVVPFALLGILLSRRKGWNVALGIAAYYASWMLIVVLIAPWMHNHAATASLVMQRWRDIALNFTSLFVLYVIDRIRPPSAVLADPDR